jgi:hypothetical protein
MNLLEPPDGAGSEAAPRLNDLDFSWAQRRLRELDPVRMSGWVTDVIGLTIEAK